MRTNSRLEHLEKKVREIEGRVKRHFEDLYYLKWDDEDLAYKSKLERAEEVNRQTNRKIQQALKEVDQRFWLLEQKIRNEQVRANGKI